VATNVNTLSRLLQALAERRWDDAVSLGAELVNKEEQQGHFQAARRLRGALGETSAGEGNDTPWRATGTAPSALRALLPMSPVELDQVVLPHDLREQVEELALEWRLHDQLEQAGISRRRKLLFVGPPGCGKTLTGRALGGLVSLPVMVVRFDAIVGAYLGQTAAQLREVFAYAEAVPSVLVLDEIDALAQRRGNPREVGELDRVVISLMQELEHAIPRGFVVASSNLPRLLDDALWRRFDLVLSFPSPTRRELLAFARTRLRGWSIRQPRDLSAMLKSTKSYADVDRVLGDMRRRMVLRQHME
jgi:SpoVK/Ycf46/Vps4 family AAA+-type ATPase